MFNGAASDTKNVLEFIQATIEAIMQTLRERNKARAKRKFKREVFAAIADNAGMFLVLSVLCILSFVLTMVQSGIIH